MNEHPFPWIESREMHAERQQRDRPLPRPFKFFILFNLALIAAILSAAIAYWMAK
jgi:hypothetical protein